MYVTVIICFFLVVCLILRNCSRPKKFPPGPPFAPLVGSWYAVPATGAEIRLQQWRRKYGNIIGHKIGFRYVVFVSGAEEIENGFKNINFQDRFHHDPNKNKLFPKRLGLFFAQDERWAEVRRFTHRFIGQVNTAKLGLLMHDEMVDLFSSINSGEIVEVNNKFTDFPLKIILSLLVNRTKREHDVEVDRIRTLTNQFFKCGRVTGIENFYPMMTIFLETEAKAIAIRYIQNFFMERLKEHRSTFNATCIRDYMDAFLLEQEKENEFAGTNYYSDGELICCLREITQTTSETVGNTAAFLLLYVALNHSVQNKIHQELDCVLGNNRLPRLEDRPCLPYCEATIYETMRINPVAAITVPHVVSKETMFYGYTLPENTTLYFVLSDSFVEPRADNAPESFKPERFLSKHMKSKFLNFGLGKRSCIGESLAKNTLFLFVTYFFQKYTIELPGGFENPSTEPDRGFTANPKPFKLILTERKRPHE